MKNKYQVEEINGVLHRLPESAFRATACGEMTGILFERKSLDDVKSHKNLCPVCWRGTKVFWSDVPTPTAGTGNGDGE